jgi:hypothetical protein
MSNCQSIQGQTFSIKETVNIHDFYGQLYIQEIPIEVSGLPAIMNEKFGFESIQISIEHKRTSDLKIQLQAPDGTTCWISNRNGGDKGANYNNTVFSQYGKDGLINYAKNPFIGNFIPDGQISYLNNGSNPNGTWKLLIEDLREDFSGVLSSVNITFGNNPAFIKEQKFCSFDNPELCSTTKNGVLLPDVVIVPSFSKNQWQEYAKDDPNFPSQLKIAVAIANTGIGPFEVIADLSTNLDKSNAITDIRHNLTQKVYSLNNKKFSESLYKTGTIYFDSKPGHQHYHVDDWIEIRLIKIINGNKQIFAKGSKISYCLFTTGMLFGKSEFSRINGKQYGIDMPNYGLGDYKSCELLRQGITVGGYDYYGPMYEGQYLELPKDLKNGNYILEIEIDPFNKYHESNRKNNVFSMPIEIKHQN